MVSRGIQQVVKALEGFTAREMRRIAVRCTTRLRDVTPIDTGHAQSNWIPTIGAPYNAVVGSKEDVSYGTQESQLARVAATGDKNILRSGISVSNVVPYIERLNAGYSPQAGAGYVERTIAGVVRELQAAR